MNNINFRIRKFVSKAGVAVREVTGYKQTRFTVGSAEQFIFMGGE
jgi:hypothetical protein